MAAELAQLESAAALEVRRDIQTAREQDVSAKAADRCPAKRQRLSGRNVGRNAALDGYAVQRRAEVRAHQADARRRHECQRRTGDGRLKSRSSLGISEQAVTEAE